MAQNGHHGRAERRPLSRVEQTSIERCKMSGDDPKQTSAGRTEAEWPDVAPSVRRHALVGKFLDRPLVLGKMRNAHAAQYVRRYVVVADDLYTIAPRVEKIEKLTGQRLHSGIRERLADRIPVIDHESKMTAVVGGLGAALLEREELIAQIDESRGLAPTANLEVEQAAVKCERLLDIADLEGDMVETDGARFLAPAWGLSDNQGSHHVVI